MGLLDLFKEALEVLRLLLEELDFLLALLSVIFSLLLDDALDGLNLGLLLNHLLQLLLLSLLKLSLLLGELNATMLCLELLAHGEGDRTVVEGLVGLDGRVDVPLNTQQEETPFSHIEGHLANDLFEALFEKFFPNWADATFTGLPLHELLVEHLTKPGHIDPGSRLRGSLLHPLLAYRDIYTHAQKLQHEIQKW